jgi:pimeloyl-ACP methyl ester carboxylesterase
MAGDIHQLLRNHLHLQGKVILVGHDIGLMVAYAFAQLWREEVSHLIVIDSPLPGTAVFDRLRTDPRLWHFAFHGARDVAEMLIAGREDRYFRSFFDARIYDPSAFDETERQVYVSAYSSPGALRAGLELYRAFDQDAQDNRELLKAGGKLTIPVLAVGGEISNTGPLMQEMMQEVAIDVTAVRIPRTAHWIAEEAPGELTEAIFNFLTDG